MTERERLLSAKRIRLITQHGTHRPGSEHDVEEIVPHGGYTDSVCQYRIAGNTYVVSDNAEVVN